MAIFNGMTHEEVVIMKSIHRVLSTLLVSMVLLSNSTFATAIDNANHVFQVATIGSLARGVYDGDYKFGDLFKQGNQGLGTFEAIDGEMVAVDGQYYQINAEGKLRKVTANEIVPFAEVINFKPKHVKQLNAIDSYDTLMTLLVHENPYSNTPYAIRIDGEFKHLRLRSLRRQKKPYPSLAEAAKTQAIFNLENTKGTIVGFWFPQYWAGIAVPGFHLHFVTDDRTIGGHVLGLSINKATLSTANVNKFTMHFPRTKSFSTANLDPKSLHEEIKSAEGGVK